MASPVRRQTITRRLRQNLGLCGVVHLLAWFVLLHLSRLVTRCFRPCSPVGLEKLVTANRCPMWRKVAAGRQRPKRSLGCGSPVSPNNSMARRPRGWRGGIRRGRHWQAVRWHTPMGGERFRLGSADRALRGGLAFGGARPARATARRLHTASTRRMWAGPWRGAWSRPVWENRRDFR